MEKEGKVVLTGSYQSSYDVLRKRHQRTRQVRLSKIISRLLKRVKNG